MNRFSRRFLPLIAWMLIASASATAQPIGDLIDKGRGLLNTDKHEEGVKHLKAAAEQLEHAIRKDPKNDELHFTLGKARFYLEQDRAAVAAYQQAIKLAPKKAKYYFMMGRALTYLDEAEQAVQALETARQLSPHAANYWFEYASALARLERFEPARAAFEKAIELDPKNDAAMFKCGTVLMKLGKQDDALVLFLKAAKLNPSAINAFHNAGQIYQNLGRHAEAVEQFRVAAKLAPDDWRVRAKLIQLYEALGKPKERDRARSQLFRLKKKGSVDKNLYCRDQFRIGNKKVFALEYFELTGDMAVRYSFVVSEGDSEQSLYRITLGSYEATTQMAREMGRIEKDERRFHLDRYFPDEKHETFAFFTNQPAYGKIKRMVRAIIAGEMQPVSSMTPTRDGAVIEIDPD